MNGRLMHLLSRSGLPQDALSDCARAVWTGRTRVTVDGQHGVIELSQTRIRLRTGEGVLLVEGEGLTLDALSAQQAVIAAARIDALSYR